MTRPMNVQLTTRDGITLQGRLRVPLEYTLGTALLLHPHPAFGGHCDVWLLPAVAARLAEEGWATLRINFRGVEGSGGTSTDGLEEHLDALAAHEMLVTRFPDVPRAVVGWSFGAMIGLRLGTAADHWVGIGTPTRRLDEVLLRGPLVPDQLPRRRTAIVGAHDQFFPAATLGPLAPDEVVVVPGTDHFMFDADEVIAGLVADALACTLVAG